MYMQWLLGYKLVCVHADYMHCQLFLHVGKKTKNWQFFFSNMQKKLAVETGNEASLTTAEGLERRAVVLLCPFLPVPQQHPDGGGGRVELGHFETLDHLPVAA